MSDSGATVLIVDDETHVRKLLQILLHNQGYRTLTASSGEEALEVVAQQPPDLILLDIMMPGMDGYEVARQLKTNKATANIPIIMLSALGERSARLTGLEAGAEDFLCKPVESAELWLRVRNLLRLKVSGDDLKSHNLTLQGQLQQRLLTMAHYDTLTGLPNRDLFYTTLKMGLTQAALSGWQLAVVTVDLDDFSNVNETRGHELGDRMLTELGQRLASCLNASDTLGRMDGDEFALILMVREDQADPLQTVERIREVLRAPLRLDSQETAMTASIGIALYPGDGDEAHHLIKHANTAMNCAKKIGRDTYRFYTAQMNVDASARQEMETALRDAVQQQAFELFYQPKIDLADGRVCGLEALLRWPRPGQANVSPAVFVPMLESLGLITEVGRWVIARVCRQIAEWQGAGQRPFQVAVNVSGQQIIEGDLIASIRQALIDHQIEPCWIEIELTESSLMENTAHTIASLQTLQALGVKVSIDDFGTGYSSLAYLRRFPIDKLKIDIAFIREVTSNPQDAAIARTIIELAHSLNLQVIAEGVETVEQLEFLTQNGCDQVQGYLFSRPLPIRELEVFLRTRQCLT